MAASVAAATAQVVEASNEELLKLFSKETSETEKNAKFGSFSMIISALLDAGYFRVKITSLSVFDKVIGGLCWAITASGIPVDVDILFEENLPLGKKISLSENITKALRGMKCPAALEPFQIQGYDFPAINAVMKWLIKYVKITRAVTSDTTRMLSELQFSKNFLIPGDENVDGRRFLSNINSMYRPVRVFRRPASLWDKELDEASLVQACLLEYGEKAGMSDSLEAAVAAAERADNSASMSTTGAAEQLSQFEKQFASAQKAAEAAEAEERARAEKREAQLMKEMMGVAATGNITGENLGRVLAGEASEIAAMSEEHAARLEATRNAAGGVSGANLAAAKRRKEALDKQIASAEEALAAAQREYAAVMALLESSQSSADDVNAYNAKLRKMIARLVELEGKSEHAEKLAMLKNLIEMSESLKKQEVDFKANCRDSMKKLNDQLDAIKNGSFLSAEEEARLAGIESMHASVEEKYNKGRTMLAKRNLEIAKMIRLLDDVPTRTELMQYERRFAELYEEVAAKLEENRKYVNMYNSLDQRREFLVKQVALMDSINEQFEGAMSSSKSKASFLAQFEKIVGGMANNLDKLKFKDTIVREKLESARAENQELIDGQRQYFKAVKDFQEECDRNERLQAKLGSK
jgi:hypothetical protein